MAGAEGGKHDGETADAGAGAGLGAGSVAGVPVGAGGAASWGVRRREERSGPV